MWAVGFVEVFLFIETGIHARRGRLGELALFTKIIRREQDRVLDLFVAGTAAEIALDGFLDVLTRRAEVLIQQRFSRDDHAGDAEAALHRTRFGKAVLIHAHLIGVDALDGQHLFALQFRQGYNAGFGLFAVDEDGTGAAYALGTAVLGGGQMQIVTQKTEQFFIMSGFIIFSVDIDCKHSNLL